jgi:very-short-patch-repair endonuclease
MVVGLSGTRYDIEVDGRQHYFTAEAIAEDNARDSYLRKIGYKIIRIRAKDVMRSPDIIKKILGHLV